MDPSKAQSDGENDVHSLEGADTVVESKLGDDRHANTSAGADTVINATGTGNDGASKSTNKPPFFKRLWQRFNIYLLLFILVVLVAIAITVVLFLKNRAANKQAQATISSQNLSPDALKQLADTSVSVCGGAVGIAGRGRRCGALRGWKMNVAWGTVGVMGESCVRRAK